MSTDANPLVDLPPHLALAAEALRPLAERLRADLHSRAPVRDDTVYDALNSSVEHLDHIGRVLERLATCVDQFGSDVLKHPEVTPIEVGRAAGRLEEVLSDMSRGYRRVRRSRSAPDNTWSIQARNLMSSVYRHHMKAILGWLDRLLATLSNPIGVAREQGLPIEGSINLTVTLELTTPPAFEKFEAMVDEVNRSVAEQTETPQPPAELPIAQRVAPPPGPLAHLGALAFGLAMAGRAFRRRRF